MHKQESWSLPIHENENNWNHSITISFDCISNVLQLYVFNNWCLFTYVLQQEKIQALQLFADQLIGGEHYDSGAISDKRDQVLDRYVAMVIITFWVFGVGDLEIALLKNFGLVQLEIELLWKVRKISTGNGFLLLNSVFTLTHLPEVRDK